MYLWVNADEQCTVKIGFNFLHKIFFSENIYIFGFQPIWAQVKDRYFSAENQNKCLKNFYGFKPLFLLLFSPSNWYSLSSCLMKTPLSPGTSLTPSLLPPQASLSPHIVIRYLCTYRGTQEPVKIHT